MSQRVVHTDPITRIESEHSLKQIDGERVCVGEDGGEGDAWLLAEGEEEFARVMAGDVAEVVVRGRPQDVGDSLNLVHKVPSLEEGSAKVQLGQDAADRPHVDGFGVFFP